jgi:predicted ABC-type exoprotein transport system permease subunit
VKQFHSLIEELRQPEYLHVLINPLPVYALFLGLAALVFALALRSRAAQVTALSLVLVAAASAWPVYAAGHQAYNRVYLIVDEDGKAWLDAHMRRAEKMAFVFAALAALALAAIALPLKSPKTAFPLALITLTFAFATLAAGGWIASAGGKVRHPEFRKEPPPKNPSGHAR